MRPLRKTQGKTRWIQIRTLWVSLIAVIAIAPIAFISTSVSAQDIPSAAELIVRPHDDAHGLRETLRGPATKRGGDPLFDGVESVRPVFAQGRAKALDPSIPAYTLQVADSTALATLLERWKTHDDVRYVETNGTFQLDATDASPRGLAKRGRASDDPTNVLSDSLDHLDVVRARAAQEAVGSAEGIKIGVLDTGLFLDHPDLAGQFAINDAEDVNNNGRFDPADLDSTDADGNGYVDDVIGYDFVDRPGFFLEGEYETRDPDPSADLSAGFSGHGTLVAGITAAVPGTPSAGITGVAPGASIVPLRAFGADGRGETDDIAAAIVYAANEGVDVINMSFGRSRPSPLLHEAIQYAFERETILVGSAGNNAVDDPHYPSDYPEVLSVVWLAEDGEDVPQFSRSQFGIGVDLGAPGSSVFTSRLPRTDLLDGTPMSDLDLDDLYGSANGSSFAAPQVAGAAALLRAVDSSLTAAAVRDLLLDTAVDINDPGWDHTTGAGRLDVLQAVSRVLPARTELLQPDHDAGTTASEPIPLVGTALHPRLASYQVFYAQGTRGLDQRADPWTPITDPISRQARTDTIGAWDATDLPEGEYTLRLVSTLTDGTTIEDRRRLVIDRTPPDIRVELLAAGLIDADWGVLADVATTDDTRLRMTVTLDGQRAVLTSEFRGKRHGLTWTDARGTGGTATVELQATNTSGLTATLDTTVSVPSNRINSAYFERTETRVPTGRLLPQAPDFDGDGLRELILNQTEDGGITDTLRGFEWGPDGFAPTDTLIANVIPRDVGDTDGDGLLELLTQVAANTLLLEQASPSDPFPTQQAFIDSTGLRTPDADDALVGTLLSDLDGDGRGEIVGNNQTAWRVLEWNGADAYEETLRLFNSTSAETIDTLQNGNRFGTAAALDGDFDGDGRGDLLVGDRDGDWILYEITGNANGALQDHRLVRTTWTFPTDRVDAGDRFARGDWDGDGTDEFVTFNTSFQLPLPDGDFEPPIGTYHVWDSPRDNTYQRALRLPIAGESAGGSIATADFDDDGRDEIALSHPPALYVLDHSPGRGWQVVFHDADAPTILSRSLTPADVDNDGAPELLVATTGDHLVQYDVQRTALSNPPPRWVQARPTGATSLRLDWRAPDADSVTVFAARDGAAFDPIATTSDSALVRTDVSRAREYTLRAWRNGTASRLSDARRIRPHPPAEVETVAYPAASTVRLRFTEPLASSTRAEQFQLNGRTPTRLLSAALGRSVTLRFADPISAGTLTWTDVRDASGLRVGPSSVDLTPPSASRQTLIVEEVSFPTERQVRLRFSAPLNADAAETVDHYAISPRGRIVDAVLDSNTPREVVLRVDDVVVGATGSETTLTVRSMTSADGATLASEGNTVALNRPSEDLANVYVYPNPYRAARHGSAVTVAGLPSDATLRILSPAGRLVREIRVRSNGSGGVEWDLRDRRGQLVPSGVYLIRVEAPNSDSVLKKAAVIR
jgi:subtilisin family serine protease